MKSNQAGTKAQQDRAARVRQTFGALILCLNGLSKITTENIKRSLQFRACYFTTHPVRRQNGISCTLFCTLSCTLFSFCLHTFYTFYISGRTILCELSFKDTQKKNFSKQVLCPIKLPLRPTCTNAAPILKNIC